MYEDKCVFVMPTWNTCKLHEEEKIPSTADEVLKKLIDAIKKNLTKEQEIIIINDGSEDETIEKIAYLLKRKKFGPVQLPGRSFAESRIRRFKKPDLELTISILNFEDRQGFNMAVVKGYQQALRSEPVFVIKLDSDGQHLPKDFPELLEHAKKHPECKRVVLSGKDADPKLTGGFGFRLIRFDEPIRIQKITNSLEKFAIERKDIKGSDRDRLYGIDVETDDLIDEEFGRNVLCTARQL